VSRNEKHFVFTRNLIVFYISDEVNTSSQIPIEVSVNCQSFLSFVKTNNVRMCRVTVSVPRGCMILVRSQLLGQTAGWRGITDRMVMEGRERKRGIASNIIHHTQFIDGQWSVE
jgi:hypothetical protein